MSSLLSGFFSLSKDDNKVKSDNPQEGVISSPLPELELSMTDAELIDLKKSWVKTWEPYGKEVEAIQKQNEDYWLGKQFNTGQDKGPADNLIFESIETFLPMATRPKADPLVESDNSEEGNALSDKVRKMLIYITDVLSYNLKLKQVARYWALYLLGVMKVGWSMRENEITCVTLRPQKLILDPKATIEEGKYKGYYIGEYVEDIAFDLVARFPDKKKFVEDLVKNKMGTKIEYIFWCTDEYFFWTLQDEVLSKIKNPHWNYEQEQPAEMGTDDYGEPIEVSPAQKIPGNNHFNAPEKPYIFLSIYNLGKRPHDDTNLVQQNIPLQDLINKRLKQIDINADNANNGIAVSGDAFTEEQAANVARLRRKGATLWVPSGSVANAITDLPSNPLPNFVYESLIDYRNELRNIFGTRGSTAQGTIGEKTVGGKQIIKSQDTDRIGGGVSTYLEQFSDRVFNWFVQLMYVYYDEPHMASVLGKERAKEYIQLINTDFTRKLLIGVKEGSMIPHDPESQRGEAIELWSQKGIDPITFFERLDFPNPREAAKNLYLWQADPIQLFPDLLEEQQKQQAMQMEEQGVMQQEKDALAQQEQQARMEQEQANKLQQIEYQNLMKPQ
jgi:hypothetical protein